MKYFTFGMETMRITQNYDGKTSHYNHSHGTPADYPIDVAGVGSGQSAYFATVDMKVVAKRGEGNSATNTIWLETTEKVKTPAFEDIAWLTLTHWNDESITSKYKVGDIIKAGEIICYEGTDGATANHLHLTCGRGHCDNWLKNSKGSWVMSGNSLQPEKVMYVDKEFTKVVDTCGLKFQDKPKEEPKDSFLPERGWLQFGDRGENVEKLCQFMHDTFPAYEKTLKRDKEKLLGDYYGENIEAWIKEFQKRTDLEQDGCVGPLTLEKLKEYGFKE